jgi:hypothetical protein
MADDITIPASGTGTATPKVATDDVGGSHYQKVKLDLGADGASAPAVGTVPVSGTVTVTEPVAVDGTVAVSNFPATQPVSGTVTVTEPVTVDGTVEVSNHPTSVDVGNFPATQPVSGTVAVTHAALTELGTAIDTELQVDVVGALPAGTNNIGDVDVASLPALPAGTNNIGDVDIASMPNVTLNEPVTVDGTVTASNMTGNVAHDSPDSGNPVKIGGVANLDWPAVGVADGDRVDLWMSPYGKIHASVGTTPVSTGDGQSDVIAISRETGETGPVFVAPFVYNGGNSWDRLRGDALGLHISRQATSATATLSNVAGSASSVTLLALNVARKGATIHNDSSAILYVKFGTTASTTSYTVKMVADAYFEFPFGFTGRVDGIWASATGSARITEMT